MRMLSMSMNRDCVSREFSSSMRMAANAAELRARPRDVARWYVVGTKSEPKKAGTNRKAQSGTDAL